MTSYSISDVFEDEEKKKKKKVFSSEDIFAEDEGGLWESTKEVASSAYGAIPEPIQEGLESVGGGMM